MFGIIFLIIILSIIMLLIMCSLRRSWLLILQYIAVLGLITLYMLFILKTGGYGKKMEQYLIFPKALGTWLSYVRIPLNTLYYQLTLARLIVPFLVLSNVLYLRRDEFDHPLNHVIRFALLFAPILLFAILKEPTVYSLLFGRKFFLQALVQTFEVILLVSYCIVAVVLVGIDIQSYEIAYIRNQNTHFLVATITLSLVYVFFALMDPVFIIQDYSVIRVGPITYFLNSKIDFFTIVLATALVGISALVNFLAMLRYSRADFDRNQLELRVKKNIREAQLLTGGLIHGLKNQILTEQVILDTLIEHLQSQSDSTEALILARSLEKEFQGSIYRINMVHQSLRDFDTHLALDTLDDFLDEVQTQAQQAFPDTLILFTAAQGHILIDRPLFHEALMNLIANAVHAIALQPDGYVLVDGTFTRKHCVITVSDNGPGVPKDLQKSLFLPFVTDKNSKHNWGLGLCYARLVAKKHFGEIDFESNPKLGTTFTLSIPKLFL